MATRWEQWRQDTPEQQVRNIARDLDDADHRADLHDKWHDARLAEEREWREHVDLELGGLKKILMGFIVSAAGMLIVAALNVAILIAKG